MFANYSDLESMLDVVIKLMIKMVAKYSMLNTNSAVQKKSVRVREIIHILCQNKEWNTEQRNGEGEDVPSMYRNAGKYVG